MNIQGWSPIRLTCLISILQGTFRSLLQYHSWQVSILWSSAFFTVRLSQAYVTTGKTIALTIWTFVGRVMSLLFNTLPRFVIAFLPRSNHLLISWLQLPSAVIFRAQEEEICHYFHHPPSICHEVMGPDAIILVFHYRVLSWLLYSPSSPSSRGSLVLFAFCH